jgi:hypothetical protein
MAEFDFFANAIANSVAQTSSRYFEKGTYLVNIDNCTFFHNRKRQPRAVVSCSVIDSNNPDFPETSQVSWVVSLDSDSGPSTIKTFICDVTGEAAHTLTPKDINEAFIAPGVHGISKLAGRKALVNVYEKTTEKNTIFTKCEWKGFDATKDKLPNFRQMTQIGSSEQAQAQTAEAAIADTKNSGWGNTDNNIPF